MVLPVISTITRVLQVSCITIFLYGCVGAVNENQGEVNVNKKSLEADVTFTFEGLEKIEQLSDTRIAVYFKPAVSNFTKSKEADAGSVDFVYQVHKDGEDTPHTAFLDINLRKNLEGYFVGEVETDGRGDCGSYSMSAKKFSDPDQIILTSKNIVGCSKDEYFPSFKGVFTIAAPSGCARYNGANVSWKVAGNSEELNTEIARFEELLSENLANFANMTYAEFLANDTAYRNEIAALKEYAPASYKIYYSDSEETLVENLMQTELPVSVITVDNANLTSYSVPNLVGGKKYFFAVRASSDVISSSNKKNMELNTKIMEYTVPEREPMVFNGVTEVDVPTNAEGYNSAILRFTPCVGCDKYHFYAQPTNAPLTNSDPPIETVLLSSGAIDSYKALGLGANSPHYFYVVAEDSCGNTGTPVKVGSNTSIAKTTTPPLAPFNGVKEIEEVTGSLDRLKISWDLPDVTSGVFGKYTLYKVDEDGSNPVQLSKNFHASNPYISSLVGDEDPENPMSTSVVILNLNAGTDLANANRYCFKAIVEEDGTYGTRTMALEDSPVVCHDFYYKAPNFAGPKLGSCNVTGSTFDVTYDLPSSGTFDQFRLYYKVAGSDTLIDYGAAATDTVTVVDGRSAEGVGGFTRVEFDFDSTVPGSIKAPVFAGAVSVNPFTITGLIPATKYIFAMETYYDPDGAGPTPPFYVRPNVFRTCTTKEPEALHNGWDHIMALGAKHDGINKVDVKEELASATKATQATFMSGAISDDVKLDKWYIEEKSGAAVSEGVVQLSWYDFKIAGLGTYANSLVASGNTVVYKVERSLNSDMSGATNLGTVPINDGVYLYHFSDENGLVGGKTYYYRVVLQKNNLDVAFANTNSSDIEINEANAILKVVVPTKNMAFVHRFAFNKHQCTRINKSINHSFHAWPDISNDYTLDYDDISYMEGRSVRGSKYKTPPVSRNYDIANNYRCEYNGMGSVTEGGKFYFDIGKSFLVDRFGVGVNIGIGKCDLDSGGKNCIGYWGNTENVNTAMLGRAQEGTTFYRLTDRYYYSTYNVIVNTSFGDGTTWDRIRYLTDEQFDKYNQGMFSNNAYLPPARISHNHARTYCASRTENIDGVDKPARLGSRQEYIVFGAWHDDLAPKDIVKLESRLKINGEDDITNHACLTQNPYTTGQYRGMDYDPAPYNTNAFDPNDLSANSYPAISLIDWTAQNRGSNEYDRSSYYKTGSFSSNATHSSHLCVSKFGVQDMLGNIDEFSIEVINKTGARNVSRDYELKISELPSDVAAYWLNTAVATPAPMGPLITDYYSSKWSGELENLEVTTTSNSRFFNPITGTYFTCDNTLWGLGNDCWDIFQTSADALVGRADSDNYRYSNGTRDYQHSWTAPATDLDLRPGVLSLVGDQEGYKPFMYNYRNFTQYMSDDSWYTGDYAMVMGLYGNHNRDYNLRHDSLFSLYQRRKADTTWGNAGFRCVVPLD